MSLGKYLSTLQHSILFRVLLAVAVMASVVVLTCWMLIAFFDGLPDAKESALSNTDEIMKALQDGSIEPRSQNGTIVDECLILLRDMAEQNLGQYTSKVVYYNLDDPNYNFRPVDEVVVEVSFSDSRRMNLYFYEGSMTGCQRMKSK